MRNHHDSSIGTTRWYGLLLGGALVVLTVASFIGVMLAPRLASAAPAGCALGARITALDDRLNNGSWSYPLNENVGGFRASQTATTFTNTSTATLYDVKITLPYFYFQASTRYRPAHWNDEKGIYITDIGNASPDGTDQGMDPTDLGFTAYILDANERPSGTLTPWSRERVGDIPMTSLTAAYYNAGFPTSLTEDDRIPTWNLGDIAPGQTVDFSMEVRYERRAGGQALGWWFPEVNAAVNLGCVPVLEESTESTVTLPAPGATAIASGVTASDFDTTDFNAGALVLNRSGLLSGETLTFGVIGARVELDSDTMTVSLDGIPIGTFTDTDETLAITFTSTLSNNQLETLIHSLGVTGAQTVGVRSGSLVLTDPQGNVSNTLNLTVSFIAEDETSDENNFDDVPPQPDAGTPQAPDTGVTQEPKAIIGILLTGVAAMISLVLLLTRHRGIRVSLQRKR